MLFLQFFSKFSEKFFISVLSFLFAVAKNGRDVCFSAKRRTSLRGDFFLRRLSVPPVVPKTAAVSITKRRFFPFPASVSFLPPYIFSGPFHTILYNFAKPHDDISRDSIRSCLKLLDIFRRPEAQTEKRTGKSPYAIKRKASKRS